MLLAEPGSMAVTEKLSDWAEMVKLAGVAEREPA